MQTLRVHWESSSPAAPSQAGLPFTVESRSILFLTQTLNPGVQMFEAIALPLSYTLHTRSKCSTTELHPQPSYLQIAYFLK